jgi:hypothetical protein
VTDAPLFNAITIQQSGTLNATAIVMGLSDTTNGGNRWKPSRPYHVALEDSYVRAHWDEINALCKLNSIPFKATGEKIREGGLFGVFTSNAETKRWVKL